MLNPMTECYCQCGFCGEGFSRIEKNRHISRCWGIVQDRPMPVGSGVSGAKVVMPPSPWMTMARIGVEEIATAGDSLVESIVKTVPA